MYNSTCARGFTLRTSIAAVVDGTVSQSTGGKFANGAVSSAFIHMFNAELGNILSKRKQMYKIEELSDDKFREVMGFVGSNDEILIAKTKLQLKLRKSAILKEFPTLVENGLKVAYSITPFNIPKNAKDSFELFGNYSGFFDTSSNLSYIYSCKTVGDCNVSIIKE